MAVHCRDIHITMPPPSPPPPPPPPPKDTRVSYTQPQVSYRVMKPLPVPADHTMHASSDHIQYPPSTPPPPQVPPKVPFQPRLTPTRARLSPEERLKRQLSDQRRREREEQDAIHEEQERQARRRREKAESEQTAREEEERRKAILQDHIRHAAARREREEREAQAAEERRLHEIKERRQLEHDRRAQYTRELQQWRHEQIRRAESQSSEREEERKRWAEARRSRIQSISDMVLQDGSPGAFNGWVTIQMPDSLTWKRRYFMFDLAHAQLTLCRSQRDSTRSIDLLNLDGRIESFHEWYEGFEELEAIPHSFAVKFVGGSSWLMFADSEEDKDRLLVLLSETAGVIL